MTATIKITLEDNSTEWESNLSRMFAAAANSADSASNQFHGLSQSLDPQQAVAYQSELRLLADELHQVTAADGQLQNQLAQSAQQISQTSFGMRQFNELATAAGDAIASLKSGIRQLNDAWDTGKIAEYREGLTAFGASMKKMLDTSPIVGGLTKLFSVVGFAKEAFSSFNETVNSLADNGSESFQELRDAFNAVGKAVIEITNDPTFKSWMSMIANGINDWVVPAISSIPTALQAIYDFLPNLIGSVGEWFGIFSSGTTQTLREQEELRDSLSATEKQQARAAAYTRQANDILMQEKKKAQEAAAAAAIAQMNDLQQIDALLQSLEVDYRNMTAAGTASSGELQALAGKIVSIEKQRHSTIEKQEKEFRNQQRAAEDRELKERTRRAEEEQRLIEKTQLAEQKANEKYWKDIQSTRQAKLDAEQKDHADTLKRIEQERLAEQKQQFDKAVQNQQQNVKGIAANLNPRDVAKEVGNQRANEARQQFDAENAKAISRAKAAGHDSQEYQNLLRKREQAATSAGAKGRRDAFQGRAGADEILDAQQSLVGKVVDQGTAQGKLSKSQADALKEAARVIADQQRELNDATEEMNAIQDQLRSIVSGRSNSSHKANRMGRK